jgi:hypothetical protein
MIIPGIKPKRTRAGMPSGFMIGRVSPGVGPEQMIPLKTVGLSTGGTTKTKYHEFLGFSAPGLFAADQTFTLAGPPKQTQFPQLLGTPENTATVQYAGTNTTHFYLVTDAAQFLVYGTHLVATVTFAAGSLSGTFVYNGSTVVAAGQQLFLVCDHTADPTLANVQLNFCGDNT